MDLDYPWYPGKRFFAKRLRPIPLRSTVRAEATLLPCWTSLVVAAGDGGTRRGVPAEARE